MASRKERLTDSSILQLREKLVLQLLRLLAFGCPLLLLLSLARISVQGWMPVMGFHIVLVTTLELIWFNRHRLALAAKLWAIVLVLFCVGIGNLLVFSKPGLYSAMVLICSVMVGLQHGSRFGLSFILSAGTLGALVAGFYLHAPLQFYVEYLALLFFSGLAVAMFSQFSEALVMATEQASLFAQQAGKSQAREHEILQRLQLKSAKQAEMFAIISHELRSPASAVAMMLESCDAASFGQIKHDLEASVSHLLNVVDDMRHAVNPQQHLPLKLEAFKPASLLQQVVSQTTQLLEEQRMQLHLNLGSGADQTVTSDALRIRMVIINLIRNAALHSGGKQVWVRFQSKVSAEKPDEVATLWTVEDDGRGIDDALQASMFEAFQRGDSAAEGTGLGLFILKQIIDRLGGQVRCQRSTQGGARFEVKLNMPRTVEALAPQATKSALPELSDLRVLLVEDDPVLRRVTELLLTRMVSALTIAVNGRDALAKQQQAGYDLILTDLFMPEMNGIELLKALRGVADTTPVIAVTAAVMGDEIDELKDAGADLVLEKPITRQSLCLAVSSLRANGRLPQHAE